MNEQQKTAARIAAANEAGEAFNLSWAHAAVEYCGDYQHEGSPREDDKPCSACNGTGYVVTPEVTS